MQSLTWPGMEIEEFTRPSPEEVLEFYERHGHPNHPTIAQVAEMLEKSACVITARQEGALVGFCRGVTDGMLGRLVECKLDPAFQGPAAITRKDGRVEHDQDGIAKAMAERVIEWLFKLGVDRIDAVAYGTEVDFCQELGFRKMSGLVAMSLSRGEARAAGLER